MPNRKSRSPFMPNCCRDCGLFRACKWSVARSPLPSATTIHRVCSRLRASRRSRRAQRPGGGYLSVDADYCRAMKIPLKQGRVFESRDSKDGAHTVIVNEAFAKKFLNSASALGQRIIFEGDDNKPNPCEIVGVVGDAHHDEVR